MSFQSVGFILFLFIVFISYWKMVPKYRWTLLTGVSCIFYGLLGKYYLGLLLSTVLFSYLVAGLIEKRRHYVAKWILPVAVIVEVTVLFLFKYLGFLTETINHMFVLLNSSGKIRHLDILVPVGISFYTFQTIAYMVDVYREKTEAEKHLGHYMTSIIFFPILLSGPIEKVQNITKQIKRDIVFSYEVTYSSFLRILFGYLKKMIIADSLAVYVNQVYGDLHSYYGLTLLIVIILYTIEIYFDFSGYSDIAIGVAGLFGIRLNDNFRRPYFASSIKEFWGRWHISLSMWFREYVYFPLGGNRGSAFKRDKNLIVTFLLSGLWHGANWTFILWGMLHGFLQVFEKRLGNCFRSDKKCILLLKRLGVLIAVCVAWVFFRSESVNDAVYILTHCLHGISDIKGYIQTCSFLFTTSKLQILILLVFIIFIFLCEWKEEKGEKLKFSIIQIIALMEIALVYYMKYGTESGAFIYTQF